MRVYVFEGMDNCLKDTLIQKLRYYLPPETQVLKFSGPPKGMEKPEEFQKRHFRDMFKLISLNLIESERSMILNRAHLGEYVYSPIYRGYSAEWIFELEQEYLDSTSYAHQTKLILLYDTNNEGLKRREDGNSLSRKDENLYGRERQKFLDAYRKSLIPNKVKIDLASHYVGESKIDVETIFKQLWD